MDTKQKWIATGLAMIVILIFAASLFKMHIDYKIKMATLGFQKTMVVGSTWPQYQKIPNERVMEVAPAVAKAW